MRRRLVLLLLPALAAGQKRRKSSKLPQVDVLELRVRRGAEGVIEIDGRVRNGGERPIRNLKLLFHILAPGQQVIATQKGGIDEELLEPGDEAEFHWQMRDQARAVKVRVAATDRNENELPVDKPGPYPIE